MDAMVDVYYGVVTPTQAMMMLAGEAPPVPKSIVAEARRVLVDREKLMSEKDLKTLEKAVHLFKQYEYGKLKEISGAEIDSLVKDGRAYNKMLKELRSKIEKRMHEKTIQELYNDVTKLLSTFFGNKSFPQLIKDFENNMIKKGKIEPRYKNVPQEVLDMKNKISSGKLTSQDVDKARREALEFLERLSEYAQRADLVSAEKGLMQISYAGNRKAEIVLLGKDNFIIEGSSIKKIHDGKLVESTKEEFEKALAENKGKLHTNVSGELFNVLEKLLGKFEISF